MIPVFDLHCDTPYYIEKEKFNHIVPDELHKQGFIGAVFAHFVVPKARFPFVDAVKLLSCTIAYTNMQKSLHLVRTFKDIRKDKTNIILGVEGGHIFDNTFKQIEVFYNLGVRVFTVTWNNSNKLAHSGLEADKKGLTRRGRDFCKKISEYDIILDMSHASTRTVLDICDTCSNRVIASHSCVRTLNPSFLRNIDDLAIEAIVKKGGVVGINFSRHHLGEHSITDHIDYIVQHFGIEYAAIGSDFDGITDAVITSPDGIKDVTSSLQKIGYKKNDIKKIFSGNFMKVFQNA
jgi:membrane dipeptidase